MTPAAGSGDRTSGTEPDGRFVESLPVNPPYDGVIADAYDAWMPPGTPFPDDVLLQDLVHDAGGTGLELACGNGRLLIPLLEAGLVVEGVDSSSDMLAICRRHAQARGLDVALHLGDIAPLVLGRRYESMICPAGSFTLIDDDDRARRALRSYRAHLALGGVLALTLLVPIDDFAANLTWRLRRAGTWPDGSTVVVHEAVRCDLELQVQHVYNRVEQYDPDGRLTETLLRKHRLRWWTREQMTERLVEAGFSDIEHVGDKSQWISVAR